MPRLPNRLDQRNPVVVFVAVLVGLWVVVSVLGLLVRALFFLTWLGVLALLVTGVWLGYRAGRRS